MTIDFPAAIKELAEVERPCPSAGGEKDLGPDALAWKDVCVVGRVLIGVSDSGTGRYGNCPTCAGTGRIVPFGVLRVQLREVWINDSTEREGGHFEQSSAWAPEPDVRVACWEIFKLLPGSMLSDTQLQLTPIAPTWEETIIRAALAWAKEQP